MWRLVSGHWVSSPAPLLALAALQGVMSPVYMCASMHMHVCTAISARRVVICIYMYALIGRIQHRSNRRRRRLRLRLRLRPRPRVPPKPKGELTSRPTSRSVSARTDSTVCRLRSNCDGASQVKSTRVSDRSAMPTLTGVQVCSEPACLGERTNPMRAASLEARASSRRARTFSCVSLSLAVSSRCRDSLISLLWWAFDSSSRLADCCLHLGRLLMAGPWLCNRLGLDSLSESKTVPEAVPVGSLTIGSAFAVRCGSANAKWGSRGHQRHAPRRQGILAAGGGRRLLGRQQERRWFYRMRSSPSSSSRVVSSCMARASETVVCGGHNETCNQKISILVVLHTHTHTHTHQVVKKHEDL